MTTMSTGRSAGAVTMILAVLLAGSGVEAMDAKEDRARVRTMLAAARTAMDAGDTAAARARLDSVLVQDPDNPDAFYFLGLISLTEADTATAARHLAAGVAAAPRSRRLRLLLARVHVANGQPDSAATMAREVMHLRPHDVDAAYVLGLAVLAQGDTLTALDLWESILALERDGAP